MTSEGFAALPVAVDASSSSVNSSTMRGGEDFRRCGAFFFDEACDGISCISIISSSSTSSMVYGPEAEPFAFEVDGALGGGRNGEIDDVLFPDPRFESSLEP